MVAKVSTGIDAIDRELSGGIEAGSLVALVADPAMQSEALLHQIATTQQTLYLTTLRGTTAVENTLDVSSDDVFVKDAREEKSMDNEFLKQVTGSRSYSSPLENEDRMLDEMYDTVRRIDRGINVVLDPTNPLEETNNTEAYREILNELKTRLLATNGLGVLHCITLDDAPPLRDVTLTISDVVVKLELVQLKNQMEYRLTIPKNRGGTPLLEDTTVVIDSDIWIDESRQI